MTQVSQSAIADAIAAARKVAAATPMPGTDVATASQQTQAVATTLPPGRVRTLDDAIDSAGADIAAFLAIDASGYRVGSAGVTLIQQIPGTIKLDSIRIMYSVRFTVGGKTNFANSIDGVRDLASGRPWADVCAQAQQMDPNCRGQYDAAEIPLILLQDLVADGKTIPAGAMVGIKTPPSGYKPFMSWVKSVRAEYGADGAVPVIASVETRTKQGVKPWGVPFFTTIVG